MGLAGLDNGLQKDLDSITLPKLVHSCAVAAIVWQQGGRQQGMAGRLGPHRADG